MTTMEQIELVEAWAWLRATGGLPEWDEHFGGQRSDMEILYFKHLRWGYTHIERRWFTYALWGAWVFMGEPAEGLADRARAEIRAKFTRQPPLKNPLEKRWSNQVLENLPPFDPPFDNARRLTKMVRQIQQDNWQLAAWYKRRGMALRPADLRTFRFELSTRQIAAKIKQAEEQAHV